MFMKTHRWATKFALGLVIALASSAAIAKDAQKSNPLDELDWQIGPTTASIPGGGTFEVPEGFAFLDEANTAVFQELIQNLPTPGQTMFAPDDLTWFAIFQFDEIGYVKDDEEIDADGILAGMREGQAQSNIELERRGWETLTIDGWAHAPRYDQVTRRLEWAMLATSQPSGSKVVNFNTRVLGRRGVMGVTLVTDPSTLDADVPRFKQALQGFDFLPDQRYAAFREGDKVAAYGLGALILGGAAAAGAKSGFFKTFGKFIALGVFALFAGLWGWIKSLFSRGKREP